MKRTKRFLATFLSLILVLNTFSGIGIIASADDTKTVSGTVVIATEITATEGEDGVGGIDIYADLTSSPLGTSNSDGSFSVTVPAGADELTFSNHVFENGEHSAETDGCTIDRTVTLSGSGNVSGAVVPIIVCDYNSDGAVSGADKTYFLKALGTTANDENWNVYCNLNGDNSVTGADKVYLSKFSGKVSKAYEYPALVFEGHEHSYTAVVTAPTCTEGGYTTYTCSDCGDTYTADITAALGHAFGEWTVTTAATCTTTGEEQRECSRCDAVETREIAATGHTAGEALEENRIEPDCEATGSYDSVVYCTVCNTELSRETVTIPENGHDFVERINEPTCTTFGNRYLECQVCGTVWLLETYDELGHDYGEWMEEYEPTCSTEGRDVRFCARCGYTDHRTLPIVDHAPGDTVRENEVAPTCTQDGSYDLVTYCKYHCDTVVSTETVTVPATGHSYVAVVTEPTCTAGGYTTYTCSVCGDTYTSDETAALGHAFGEWTVTTAATCTAAGEEQRECSSCDAVETREISAMGHNYQAVVTAPTCTAGGYTTYTCSVCGDTYTSDETAALGHAFGEWTVTAAATCTTAGEEQRECSRCDAVETREISAMGHNYQAVVTAPTCTAGGYTTYTCSVCGDTYTANETAALGHTEGSAVTENNVEATCTQAGSYDTVTYCTVCGAEISRNTVSVAAPGHNWVAGTAVAPTHSADGYTPYTCSRCSATKQENVIPALNIKVKLPNTDSYLYRAGNSNSIALGSLFEIEDSNKNSIDSSAVTVTVENLARSAAGTFTANTSDWTAATVKFTGTGVVRVTVKQAGYSSAVLLLEVVAGNNITSATLSNVTSANAVLLNDVNIPTRITINNGRTLYGNGFTVTDTRSDTSGANGYINMSGGATIDNAVILGQVYPSAVTSGVTNQYYSPGIWITGNANIYNSYVSEAKNAVQIDGGNVELVNSTFSGGALSNIQIGGGNVTLKNCTTSVSTRGGLKGLGIRGTSADCKINIEGTFTQYNWLKSSDLPSTYSSVLSSVYNNSTYAYTYNSQKYVNMGIFFITDAGAITSDMAQAAVNDSTTNNYGFIEKSYSSITGTLYTAKASMGSADMLTAPSYSPTTHGQYYTIPAYTFNYTLNDFSTDDKNYCTYNGTTGVTQISFEEGSSMSWNSNILTVTKMGANLSSTVTMNGNNYTGQNIVFDTAGSYTVYYTYTDPYNYDKNGNAFSVTYTKSVEIQVTVVEQGVQVYHPDFTYANIGGTTASRTVEATVNGAKRIYVMPDVSATSSTIESKTVGGQTVYYPIVEVPASNSSGGNFSSGQLYYFAPAFKNINIVDYDQSNQTTKTAKYTYNSSTQKWPHNVSASSQPDTSVYYYTATNTSSATNRPYGRSMNEQYYGYKYVSSRGGLCFASNQIEKENNANTQVVEFYYKGTDDVTYYYYIKYSFAYGKGSSGGCVTGDSLVTMSDGTQKAVKDVKVGDMVKTWSFYNGCYEDRPVVANMYHGTKEWDVLDLNFSDGSNIEFIYDHGLFDADLNTNVYINTGNVSEYIGHHFIKVGDNGENTEVELTGYTVTVKETGAYAPLTEKNNNCIINGMYTICSEEECGGLFEYFEIGEGMKYDEEKMLADIEKYGVYTYEDLADCMSEEMFNAIDAKYYKISAAKHGIDRNEIARIFNQYM